MVVAWLCDGRKMRRMPFHKPLNSTGKKTQTKPAKNDSDSTKNGDVNESLANIQRDDDIYDDSDDDMMSLWTLTVDRAIVFCAMIRILCERTARRLASAASF